MMRILPSYILRQHLVPFLLGFGVITFILEMDVLFDYLDLVVNRGVAPGIVAQLFLLSLGYIVALSAPCAVLVAVLMTFGRLSQDNEITALRAGGVNLGSVLIAPLACSFLLAVGLVLFNNHVLPESNHAFANLLIDIQRMRPTVKLQEGVFITDLPGYNLLVQSVNGRTSEMRGVTLYQFNPGGPPTTIVARRGYLRYTPDGGTAVLELKDGEIHDIPSDEGGSRKYRRLEFKTHTINIAGAGGLLERSIRDARSDREMSAKDLISERDSLVRTFVKTVHERRNRLAGLGIPRPAQIEAGIGGGWRDRMTRGIAKLAGRGTLERLLDQRPELRPEIEMWTLERDAIEKRIAGLSVEVHKKFSLPAACVVFVLIGAPLGMRVRRAGPAVAFVSVAFFLFYYLCLIGGEELANRLLLPPWLSMWLPNIVLGAWGLDWTLKACEIRRSRPARKLPAQARAA